MSHFIIKCSCGQVITQCRCIDPNKKVEIRPHPACGSTKPIVAEYTPESGPEYVPR